MGRYEAHASTGTRDYQHSTVDSCLMIQCDAMENLLTFHLSLFFESCCTLHTHCPYGKGRHAQKSSPHHLLELGWCCLIQFQLPVAEIYSIWMFLGCQFLSPPTTPIQHFSLLLCVCKQGWSLKSQVPLVFTRKKNMKEQNSFLFYLAMLFKIKSLG